jgi:hypothetical protein
LKRQIEQLAAAVKQNEKVLSHVKTLLEDLRKAEAVNQPTKQAGSNAEPKLPAKKRS